MTPLLLIVGDDDLLLQRELERRLEELTDQDPQTSVDQRYVSELEHLPELRTTSLFGGRTCVVLNGAENLSGVLKAEIEAYAAAPAEGSVLVVVARGVGKIQKLAKLAKQVGERFDVRRPADWDDRGWDRLVGDEFRRLARKADATAIVAIRSHAGNEPGAIASQVGSVCAAQVENVVITSEHVDEVVSGHGKQSGFAVADAVAERDPAGALVTVRGALEAGEAPLAVLGALAFRFRQLLRVRSGASPKEAGISVPQHRRLQSLAAAFHPGELAWCHDRLAQLDVDLKGAELPDALLLEIAIVELATSHEVGAPFNPLAARPA